MIQFIAFLLKWNNTPDTPIWLRDHWTIHLTYVLCPSDWEIAELFTLHMFCILDVLIWKLYHLQDIDEVKSSCQDMGVAYLITLKESELGHAKLCIIEKEKISEKRIAINEVCEELTKRLNRWGCFCYKFTVYEVAG